MKYSTKPYRKKHQGFSLVELMFAMVVLTVAILGGMLMVSMGMLRNNTNKLDTTATNVAQTVLEDIAGTDPTTANTLTKTIPLHAPAPPRILPGLGKLYCRVFHRQISRPFHGRYRCWKCLREFDAGWARR